jgi:hypothetical protein
VFHTLTAALRQMRLQRGLVGEEMIKPAVEPILGDLLIAELQQIAQRRAAVPVLIIPVPGPNQDGEQNEWARTKEMSLICAGFIKPAA